MRLPAAVALAALVATLAPAADTPPLLRPVNPPGGSACLRLPVEVGKSTDSFFRGQVTRAKGKKGSNTETVDVTVSFETLPGRASVTIKKWQSWGYEVPPNKQGVLPELVLRGVQVAPKLTKGFDADVKLTNVTLDIVDGAGGSDLVFGCDLHLTMRDLTRGADRALDPRYHFGDKFLEFTAPNAAFKRPGTGDEAPAAPAASDDPALVVVSGPTVVRGVPVFAFASVNGLPQYKTPEGKFETVNAGVSSSTNWSGGVLMTIGTARGCGVEFDNEKDVTGMGANFQAMVAKGKVKELRLGFQTGPGLRAQKDLVLKDVDVWVDKNNSGHFVWLGTKFVNEHLTDAVYAYGPDGMWRLHGRMKPDLLQDIKTRTPPKKP